MTTALRILQEITTDYSIFEKDQVLTERQLNSVTDYLNDQTRLTRIYLLGVGVVSGLRVSLSSDLIKVTKGVGITTDSDLLFYSNDTICDRFTFYDKSYPKYAPFYFRSEGGQEEMIAVYELIPQGVTDSRNSVFSLSEFGTQTNKNLRDMVAVLLMESYVNDPDICTGTDCDNLGQDCINTPKLLLIDRTSINSLLKPAIATPDQAVKSLNENTLNEVVIERPLISSSVSSVSALANTYRVVCANIYSNLNTEIAKIYLQCAAFLNDVLLSDPTNKWQTLLNKIHNDFTENDLNIQYYYDFLKDVAETYNHFRDLLFGDMTWCCPDINWFPKHLLLGNLVLDEADDPQENRIGFYPSPAISQTAESLNHAKFLVRKLDALIQNFQIPAVSDEADSVRITPSLFEDQPLENRAIPYYYHINLGEANSIYKSWNYHLNQRRMDNRNYSYNASLYSAQGAAANPLTTQIGKFSFFRIEGHLGKNVETVISRLESEIKSKNLPFTIRSILLGEDKTKVVNKPSIRYSDLHRFHYLLRQDVSHQLEEVSQFSNEFKKKVDANVMEESNAQSLKELATQSNQTVTANAESVSQKLNLSYRDYKTDQSWKPSFLATITAASEFKSNISPVLKTEFTTPFDSLISNTHILWLDWLDEIIKNKDDGENEKLLFAGFVSQNPSIEHFAGVVRGGTFVLIYDDNNTVVGDFMLPYYHEDKVEAAPVEPTLTKPTIRPDAIIDQGIRVIPSFERRFSDFKGVLEPELTKKFDTQQKYADIYKGFVDSTKDIFIGFGKGTLQTAPPKITDYILGSKTQEMVNLRERVNILKQKAILPELPDTERTAVASQIQQAETDLAESLKSTTEHIAISGLDVSAGSEGFQAMTEVSSSIANLSPGGEALKNLQTGLTATLAKTNNIGLTTIISNISNTIRR